MKVQFKPPNLDFLKQSGPAGYVAGSLRNDKGFTLRPDMAPIDVPVGSKLEEQGLFAATTNKTLEDDEADAIYASIEDRLKRKHKKRSNVDVEDSSNEVFGDLKPELERVSVEEWASIPEATDFRIKKLKRLGNYQDPKAKDRFIPLPDNLLSVGSIGYDLQAEGFQIEDEEEKSNSQDRLLQAGEAREAALGLALDSLEKTLGKSQNQTANSVIGNSGNTVIGNTGDVDKARSVLKSLLRTNPQVPSAWLAAARLEHSQGKLKLARHLLSQGCEQCPEDADLWIEAIRLTADKPAMLEKALESEASRLHDALWIECLRYQKTVAARLKLMQSGLQVLPKSPRLWEEYLLVVDAEERENVLEAAIQCAPQFNFYLELAQLLLNTDLERAMALCNETAQLSKLPIEQFRLYLLINEIKERLGKELLPLCLSDLDLDPKWFIQAEKRGSIKTVNHLMDSECIAKLLPKFIQAEAWECAKAVLRTNSKLFSEYKLPRKFFEYLVQSGEIDRTVIYDAWYKQDPSIMDEAFKNGIASEEMWCKYLQDQLYDPSLFQQARSAYPQSTRITVLQAQNIVNTEEALEFVKVELDNHSDSPELWLLYARLSQGSIDVYKQAVEKCPGSAELWINYSHTMPSVHRARATLDIGRRKLAHLNQSKELLKLLDYCVQFEKENGNELGLKALEQQLDLLKSKFLLS